MPFFENEIALLKGDRGQKVGVMQLINKRGRDELDERDEVLTDQYIFLIIISWRSEVFKGFWEQLSLM